MGYTYKVFCICEIEQIPANLHNNIREFFENYNIECFEEYFYYRFLENDDNFIPTYNTEIEFNFDENKYIFSYECYHPKKNRMDQFKQLFSRDDFNVNTIFDVDGNSAEEHYMEMGFEKKNKIEVIDGELVHEIYEMDEENEIFVVNDVE